VLLVRAGDGDRIAAMAGGVLGVVEVTTDEAMADGAMVPGGGVTETRVVLLAMALFVAAWICTPRNGKRRLTPWSRRSPSRFAQSNAPPPTMDC